MADTTAATLLRTRGRIFSGALPVVAFSTTMLISAALLFMVQPMFTKMLLPLLGGTPAVWNTSMLFFQTALLAGYAYAHYSIKRLGVRRQVVLHLALVGASLAFLPVAVPGGWQPRGENPAIWLLALLTVVIGLPFFVVSTTSPTLQRWFATLGHRSAGDPYFLYAASNVGSLVALLSYPILAEPMLRLTDQAVLWSAGYAAFALLTLGAAIITWRSSSRSGPAKAEVAETAVGRLAPTRRLRWVALAFVPSSLMLGVTTYFTTDIAPIPLLWVIPLSLYLATFILVFSKRTEHIHRVAIRASPFAVVVLALTMVLNASEPLWLIIGLHLAAFFLIALACHGRVAADRPGASHLTSFYLSLAIGGALGGLFNAIVAPVVFDSLVEYPIVLVCASLLVSRSTQTSARWAIRDMMAPLLVVAVGLLAPVAERIGWPGAQWANAGRILLAVAALICFAAGSRPLRFALCVSALFLANAVPVLGSGTILFSDRSFFGVSSVGYDAGERRHVFNHGSTLHGFQSMDADQRLQPASYYDESGPLGAVFAPGPAAGADVAVIGLGTGTMACYAKSGQSWTFYELDPTVVRVARDERLFTYLRDCPGSYDVVVGDGRLNLQLASPGRFALITIDAFSSDAIPMHLLTTEAMDVYKDKLASDGVLLFHISNRYLDLRGVLSRLASESGLVAYVGKDTELDDNDRSQYRSPSVWVAMAQRDAILDGLGTDSLWAPLRPIENAPLWTDDYSNILSVLRAN
jgi:hypothetical protein